MPAGRVDLRPLLPPVRDQGGRGTCLAFAVTAAHEVAKAGGAVVSLDLAEEVLYWGCKEVDGDHLPGSSFRSASVALARWGQPDEALWPYDESRNDTDSSFTPPAAAIDPSACHMARLRSVPVTIDEVKRWLAADRPIALGMILTDGVIYTTDGQVPPPTANDIPRGDHAVLIVGFEDGATPGEGHFIIRNSWGPGWGDSGYGYLPYAYVVRYGKQTWIID